MPDKKRLNKMNFKMWSELHGKPVDIGKAMSSAAGQEGCDTHEHDLLQAGSDAIRILRERSGTSSTQTMNTFVDKIIDQMEKDSGDKASVEVETDKGKFTFAIAITAFEEA